MLHWTSEAKERFQTEGKPWTKNNGVPPKPIWWLGCKQVTRGKEPLHKRVCKPVSRMPIGCGSPCDNVVRRGWKMDGTVILSNCVERHVPFSNNVADRPLRRQVHPFRQPC